jgi:hypothetical protein
VWRLRKFEQSEQRWRSGNFSRGEGTAIGCLRRKHDDLFILASAASASERSSFRMPGCLRLRRVAMARAHRLFLVRYRLRLATLFTAEP